MEIVKRNENFIKWILFVHENFCRSPQLRHGMNLKWKKRERDKKYAWEKRQTKSEYGESKSRFLLRLIGDNFCATRDQFRSVEMR